MVKRFCPSCRKNTTDFFDVLENTTLCSECRKPYPVEKESREAKFVVGEVVRRKAEHHNIFGWYYGDHPFTISWVSTDHSLVKFKELAAIGNVLPWEAHRFERVTE